MHISTRICQKPMGLELHCRSTNHNAGHQMTPGSLLMYSCDPVCLVTVVLLSFDLDLITHS